MSGEGWQPGDLALCVKGGKVDPDDNGPSWPQCGRVYTVEDIGTVEFSDGPDAALWFYDAPENNPGERVWWAGRFIKVTPPEADEFDQETIRLLNGAPAKVDA